MGIIRSKSGYCPLPYFWSDMEIAAAGLPKPAGEPPAHYSPGVDVRIGRPERGA